MNSTEPPEVTADLELTSQEVDLLLESVQKSAAAEKRKQQRGRTWHSKDRWEVYVDVESALRDLQAEFFST